MPLERQYPRMWESPNFLFIHHTGRKYRFRFWFKNANVVFLAWVWWKTVYATRGWRGPSQSTCLSASPSARVVINIFSGLALYFPSWVIYKFLVNLGKIWFIFNGLCETHFFVLRLRAQSSCFTHGVRIQRSTPMRRSIYFAHASRKTVLPISLSCPWLVWFSLPLLASQTSHFSSISRSAGALRR